MKGVPVVILCAELTAIEELLRAIHSRAQRCGLGESEDDFKAALCDALVAIEEAKGYLMKEGSTNE